MVKSQLVILAFNMGTGLNPRCSIPGWTEHPGPWQLIGRNSWILPSVWPTPGPWDHLGNKTANIISPSLHNKSFWITNFRKVRVFKDSCLSVSLMCIVEPPSDPLIPQRGWVALRQSCLALISWVIWVLFGSWNKVWQLPYVVCRPCILRTKLLETLI